MRFALPAILVCALSSGALAQGPGQGPDTTINAATRTLVITGALRRLDQGYVFPQKVAAMRHALRARAKQGGYDRISSAQAFADTLTRDLQAISRDKHLEVAYRSGGIVDEPPDAEPPAEEQLARTEFARRVITVWSGSSGWPGTWATSRSAASTFPRPRWTRRWPQR